MKEELKHIKHAITLLQKAVAQLEGQLPVETEKKQSKFKQPAWNDACTYHAGKGYRFDFDEWWNHYMANGWKVGQNPMKDWKACMAQWESRYLKEHPVKTEKRYDAHGREIDDVNRRLL